MTPVLAVGLAGLDHSEGVAHPELTLQVQRGAHCGQSPLHHDGNAVTQHIGFLHAVCGQHNGSVSPVLLDHVPREPAETGQWRDAETGSQ